MSYESAGQGRYGHWVALAGTAWRSGRDRARLFGFGRPLVARKTDETICGPSIIATAKGSRATCSIDQPCLLVPGPRLACSSGEILVQPAEDELDANRGDEEPSRLADELHRRRLEFEVPQLQHPEDERDERNGDSDEHGDDRCPVVPSDDSVMTVVMAPGPAMKGVTKGTM